MKMKRMKISCLEIISNLFYYANLCFRYAQQSAQSILNSKFNKPTCRLKRLQANKYKITVTFPDRTVMIQFKRPRGPINLESTTKPEMYPYLQNERKTPIKIISPAVPNEYKPHCKTANDYEEEAWKIYEKNCLVINE